MSEELQQRKLDMFKDYFLRINHTIELREEELQRLHRELDVCRRFRRMGAQRYARALTAAGQPVPEEVRRWLPEEESE